MTFERFSIECRKTKTRVNTSANHKGHRQYSEPIKSRNNFFFDWSGDQTAPINSGSCADHNIFCDLMGDNFLQQFIPGPTHLAGNKLDLLLCNWPVATCSRRKARENACERVTIGLGFTSDWIKKLGENF